MGFFTDAYDLFIIGTATTLISKQWGLTSSQTGLINSITLLSAFIGAIFFGRLSDKIGRKRTYGLEAAIMVVGALASAFSPSLIWLLVFRFILGVGVGGDYPMSAVLMSEYSNTKSRGKLVGLVFAMQALGTVTGYVVALALLSANVNPDLAWRIMLGFGAIPAAGVIYFRRKMPESPRYTARVNGDSAKAASDLSSYSEGELSVAPVAEKQVRLSLGQFLSNPKYYLYLIGTAGSWFVFDYAYYGNSVSAPLIVKSVLGHHGAHVLTEAIALQLIIFSVFAVPGYYLGAVFMDKIGHKRLQLIGFFFMGLAFLLIGVIPNITTLILPFLLLFGISYFFANFGPNETTFVLSAEVYPTSARSTGHGISAGIAKFGAFLGVYLFPIIKKDFGVSGALEFSFGMALVGLLVTLLLPEPARKSLDNISGEDAVSAAESIVKSAQEKIVPTTQG
jgi:PHS family inorganic phosphate transporter-like MFS transporter